MKDKLNYYKQLLDILIEEANVQNVIIINFVDDEEKKIELAYNGKRRDFNWINDGEEKKIKNHKKVSKFIIKTLDYYFNKTL